MEEINEIHTKSLEWGCVCNLIDRIADIEDKMEGHWDELMDMLADMVSDEGKEKDPAKVFFYIYEYCFRLYYYLRSNPVKQPFNQISKVNIGGKEVYRVKNYDYKTYKWAMQLAQSGGYLDEITNGWLNIPADKLTTNQRRAFDRRIGD